MIPVSVDIRPADEMIYVLAEIMRLEAEWRNMKDNYLKRFDFSEEWITSKIPRVEELSDEDIISFCQAVGVSPSDVQIKLFIKRFGQFNKVNRHKFERIFLGSDGVASYAKHKETVGTDTMEYIRTSVSTLFRILYTEDRIKFRLTERKVKIEEAFKAFGVATVEENTMRDALLNSNVMSSTIDIQHMIHMIAGEGYGHFNQDQLANFLEPAEEHT